MLLRRVADRARDPWALVGLAVLVAGTTVVHDFFLLWSVPIAAAVLWRAGRGVLVGRRLGLIFLPALVYSAIIAKSPMTIDQTRQLFGTMPDAEALHVIAELRKTLCDALAAVFVDVRGDRLLAYLVSLLCLLPVLLVAGLVAQRRWQVFLPVAFSVAALCAVALDWVRWFSLGTYTVVVLAGMMNNTLKGTAERSLVSSRWVAALAVGVAGTWLVAYDSNPYQGAEPLVSSFFVEAERPSGPPAEYAELLEELQAPGTGVVNSQTTEP